MILVPSGIKTSLFNSAEPLGVRFFLLSVSLSLFFIFVIHFVSYIQFYNSVLREYVSINILNSFGIFARVCETEIDILQSLSNGWSRVPYAFEGQGFDIFRAHAQGDNPHTKITFFTGLKATAADYNIPRIHAFQRAGFEIDFVPLIDESDNYFDRHVARVRGILRDSPPMGHFKGDLHHYIFGHSMGARSVLVNFMDEAFVEDICSDYTGFAFFAPHITSSFRKNPILRNVQKLAAQALPRSAVALKTGARLQAMTRKDPDGSEYFKSFTNLPTDLQILRSTQEGEAFQREIRERGFPRAIEQMAISVVAGREDEVSDFDAAKELSKSLSASFYGFEAGHDLFKKRDVRRIVLQDMKSAAAARQRPYAGMPFIRDPNSNYGLD